MRRAAAIWLLVFAAVPGSAGAAFTTASSPIVGDEPRSLAVGDFWKDGSQDLVTINYGAHTVSVLPGDGKGGFRVDAGPELETSAASVAVGDFNTDGNQDLVTASPANKVFVLVGDGVGGFTSLGGRSVGSSPSSVAVGDFNGDGSHDIAAANQGADTVSVLVGNGGGSFTTASTTGVGKYPSSLAVGDFNGDGKHDLAVANQDADTVSVLAGVGDGTFTTASTPGVGEYPKSLAVGDFNGDRNQDVVTANEDSDTVSVLAGNGAGGFSAAGSHGVGRSPESVAVGDFNRDGNQDLAVANDGADTVSVLAGNGAGGFSAAGTPVVGDRPWSVVVGDFNGDGNQDLATANGDADSVTVLVSTDAPVPNLLVNGEAEAAGAGGTLTASPVPPGWTREQGKLTYVRYGSPGGFVPMLFGPPLRGGLAHFAGGPASSGADKSNSAASQTVDVSGSARAIDQGRATAHLAGMLGGSRNDTDRAQVTATFLDANGTDLGGTMQIGPVTAAERKNITGLLRRSADGPVPAGTRRVQVRIQTLFDCCTYDDGYADNLSLTLTGEAVEPAPADPGPGEGPGGGGAEEPLAISGLKVKPSKFRAASKGGPIASAAKKAPVGTTVAYTLNRAAPATFKIARRAAGVRKGKKCVAPPRRGRPTGKRCTRYVSAGSFKQLSVPGANSLRFTGRIKNRKLAPGSYRLSLSAALPGAPAAKAKDVSFTIVR